jgi:hypothetical protein
MDRCHAAGIGGFGGGYNLIVDTIPRYLGIFKENDHL